MDYSQVKRVHVVVKTHLDAAFTAPAAVVHQQYLGGRMEAVLDLARRLNRDGQRAFVWTLGSYMVDYALRYGGPSLKAKLEEGIRRGDLVWHALAVPAHTELMDGELLDFGLSIGAGLDKRFSRTTIACRINDMPGHTRSMIPHLARFGVKYMSIANLGCSLAPDLPPTFLWRDPQSGSEVVVQYCTTTDIPCCVEGMEDALEFIPMGDNAGPTSEDEVTAAIDRIRRHWGPNVQICASTMDDYASKLWDFREHLPVYTGELGDTWIFGAASDPVKVAAYRELLHLRTAWEKAGLWGPSCPGWEDFNRALLMIPEHSWGVDSKKYLGDFRNWDKEDFTRARALDQVGDGDFPMHIESLRDAYHEERDRDGGTYSYRLFEATHEEQRRYLALAVSVLPDQLRQQAESRIRYLTGEAVLEGMDYHSVADYLKPYVPKQPVQAKLEEVDADVSAGGAANPISIGEEVTFGNLSLVVGPDGSLQFLKNLTSQVIWIERRPGHGRGGYGMGGNISDPAPGGWTGASTKAEADQSAAYFGRLLYTTYDYADVINTFNMYVRDPERNWKWCESDYGKPGMEYAKTARHGAYPFTAVSTWRVKDRLIINLAGNAEAAHLYGCPHRAQIAYDFSGTAAGGTSFTVTVSWFDKDANRLPEGLWLDMAPQLENPSHLRLTKLGETVDPMEVVRGGGRRLHAVEKVTNRDQLGTFTVINEHAPLVSLGGHFLYEDNRPLPDLEKGFSYLLYDNRWGTNFKAWCEDDARFEFRVKL